MASVEVCTTEYEFSHGHKPRGRGSWAFAFGHADAEPRWIHLNDNRFSLTYGDAKMEAIKLARAERVARIYVCT